MIDGYKGEVLSTVEKDAIDRARMRLNAIKSARGGKFKLSEKQFCTELENIWIWAELSAAERIMRCAEADLELSTRDLLIGEMHSFVMACYDILKKRVPLKMELKLDDLLYGPFATKVAVDSFEERTVE